MIRSSVCFYISGHGFGHASRQIEIINALGARRPELGIVVRTAAAAWLFERTVRVPFTLVPGACDTGVAQLDSLHLDAVTTIREADAFHRDLADRAATEAALLREHDVRLVIADAPPLGCAAAAAARVPGFVVSNFTWDWIYEEYSEHLGAAPELLPAIRSAYASASGAWRLPMHGGFETFTSVTDVPFVARHASHSREEVRTILGLPSDDILALSSFGGYGVYGFDPTRLDCLDRYGVVLTHRDSAMAGTALPGIHHVSETALYEASLHYEDLVAAVDVVVTKPGYGIIAECLANDTAILYTSRGRFVEYDVLVREMPRFLRCTFIDQERALAGQWRDALDRVTSLPLPRDRPGTDGADVVANLIAENLEQSA